MPFSMSQTALPTFEIMLNALSGVLEKAEAFAKAKKIDDRSEEHTSELQSPC